MTFNISICPKPGSDFATVVFKHVETNDPIKWAQVAGRQLGIFDAKIARLEYQDEVGQPYRLIHSNDDGDYRMAIARAVAGID